MAPYPTKVIANYLLKLACNDGVYLKYSKLKYLLYLAEGIHLAYFNTKLIDEYIEVWEEYGFVIYSIYCTFNAFRNTSPKRKPIKFVATSNNGHDGIELRFPIHGKDNQESIQIIVSVWDTFKMFSIFVSK